MSLRDSISTAFVSGPIPQPDQSAEFVLQFNADDPCFAGHFPGQPLLPGVFQIEMTRVAAESLTGASLRISEIIKAKFLRPIVPGETIRLRLKLKEDRPIFHVRAGLNAGGQPAGENILKLCLSA